MIELGTLILIPQIRMGVELQNAQAGITTGMGLNCPDTH
jgi:hypothetical protein